MSRAKSLCRVHVFVAAALKTSGVSVLLTSLPAAGWRGPGGLD